MKCPTCRKEEVKSDSPLFPFCSDRCKLVDLAAWASDKYVIAGETTSKATTDTNQA